MNGLFAAAGAIQGVLVGAGWRFCFIGGLAVQRWGERQCARLDVAAIENELVPLLELKGDQAALARFRAMLG